MKSEEEKVFGLCLICVICEICTTNDSLLV